LYKDMKKLFPDSESDLDSSSLDLRFDTSEGVFAGLENGASLCDYVYDNNLRINFKDNGNLRGRNVERAIKDFQRVVKIANEHAFAWNCLAKGYKTLNRRQEAEKAVKKTQEIVKASSYWRDKFKELDFAIEQ